MENRNYKQEYEEAFRNKARILISERKRKTTQEAVARSLNISVRKVQMFEKGNCLDSFMLYGYKQILDEL